LQVVQAVHGLGSTFTAVPEVTVLWVLVEEMWPAHRRLEETQEDNMVVVDPLELGLLVDVTMQPELVLPVLSL
jgi:hypothetical protein